MKKIYPAGRKRDGKARFPAEPDTRCDIFAGQRHLFKEQPARTGRIEVAVLQTIRP